MAITPVKALPAESDVLIVELQVRGTAAMGAADQEFIEVYNTTNKPIDVSTWKLQYKSATGSTWTDKITMHGSIDAYSSFLLVSDKYPNPPSSNPDGPAIGIGVFSAGLSDSGGNIRIVDMVVPAMPVVHDQLGWGSTSNAAEGNAPTSAPAGGKSLHRKIIEEDDSYQDTDNNANDFYINSNPSPQADELYVIPPIDLPPVILPETPPAPPAPTEPIPDPVDTTVPTEELEPTQPVVALLSPQITELMPNPAAPASDSTDEYIEIYNPNDRPLSLAGYKLQSGNSFTYSHTFDTDTLDPYEYKAFLVTQTGNILSNTSGQARMLDPNDVVAVQTGQYESAPEGQSWVLLNGTWQWTTTPTPNQANVLTAEPLKAVGIVKPPNSKTPTASKPKSAIKTKTPAKTKAVAKPKVAAAAKPAKKTTAKKAASERQVYQDPATSPPKIHTGILAGVGAATLLYAGYEYRHDAVNTVRRFQRYRGLRRAARP